METAPATPLAARFGHGTCVKSSGLAIPGAGAEVVGGGPLGIPRRIGDRDYTTPRGKASVIEPLELGIAGRRFESSLGSIPVIATRSRRSSAAIHSVIGKLR